MVFGIFKALAGHGGKGKDEKKPAAADKEEAPKAQAAEAVEAVKAAESTEVAKEDDAEVAPPADAPAKAAPQPVQCEIEKAIFDSNAGFADWTEEADWGSSEPAPAEVENEDGWTMKTTKTKTPKKGKVKGKKRAEGSSKPRATAPVVEEPTMETKAIAHANPMQALMASMEEELGIEVARTDDESESESEAEAEEKPAPAAAAVPEKKEEEKKQQPLSKKERQEQKKKELDDLDDLLAEFGIDTAATNDTANDAGASKSSKKKKKKKSTGAGEAEAVQATAPADPAPAAGAAIDIEAAKKALAAKKKGSSGGAKKVSAAQAAAKAASSKGKKKKGGVDYDR